MMRPELTCRACVDLLGEQESTTLPPDRRALFDAHLACCPSCASYSRTYREAVRLAKAAFRWPDDRLTDLPEELLQAVLMAVRQTR